MSGNFPVDGVNVKQAADGTGYVVKTVPQGFYLTNGKITYGQGRKVPGNGRTVGPNSAWQLKEYEQDSVPGVQTTQQQELGNLEKQKAELQQAAQGFGGPAQHAIQKLKEIEEQEAEIAEQHKAQLEEAKKAQAEKGEPTEIDATDLSDEDAVRLEELLDKEELTPEESLEADQIIQKTKKEVEAEQDSLDVNVAGEKVRLSGEALDKYKKLEAAYTDRMNKAAKIGDEDVSKKQQKKLSMEFSAALRDLTGLSTPKEQAAKEKETTKLVAGREGIIRGENGEEIPVTVTKPPAFGNVTVQTEDGKTFQVGTDEVEVATPEEAGSPEGVQVITTPIETTDEEEPEAPTPLEDEEFEGDPSDVDGFVNSGLGGSSEEDAEAFDQDEEPQTGMAPAPDEGVAPVEENYDVEVSNLINANINGGLVGPLGLDKVGSFAAMRDEMIQHYGRHHVDKVERMYVHSRLGMRLAQKGLKLEGDKYKQYLDLITQTEPMQVGDGTQYTMMPDLKRIFSDLGYSDQAATQNAFRLLERLSDDYVQDTLLSFQETFESQGFAMATAYNDHAYGHDTKYSTDQINKTAAPKVVAPENLKLDVNNSASAKFEYIATQSLADAIGEGRITPVEKLALIGSLVDYDHDQERPVVRMGKIPATMRHMMYKALQESPIDTLEADDLYLSSSSLINGLQANSFDMLGDDFDMNVAYGNLVKAMSSFEKVDEGSVKQLQRALLQVGYLDYTNKRQDQDPSWTFDKITDEELANLKSTLHQNYNVGEFLGKAMGSTANDSLLFTADNIKDKPDFYKRTAVFLENGVDSPSKLRLTQFQTKKEEKVEIPDTEATDQELGEAVDEALADDEGTPTEAETPVEASPVEEVEPTALEDEAPQPLEPESQEESEDLPDEVTGEEPTPALSFSLEDGTELSADNMYEFMQDPDKMITVNGPDGKPLYAVNPFGEELSFVQYDENGNPMSTSTVSDDYKENLLSAMTQALFQGEPEELQKQLDDISQMLAAQVLTEADEPPETPEDPTTEEYTEVNEGVDEIEEEEALEGPTPLEDEPTDTVADIFGGVDDDTEPEELTEEPQVSPEDEEILDEVVQAPDRVEQAVSKLNAISENTAKVKQEWDNLEENHSYQMYELGQMLSTAQIDQQEYNEMKQQIEENYEMEKETLQEQLDSNNFEAAKYREAKKHFSENPEDEAFLFNSQYYELDSEGNLVETDPPYSLFDESDVGPGVSAIPGEPSEFDDTPTAGVDEGEEVGPSPLEDIYTTDEDSDLGDEAEQPGMFDTIPGEEEPVAEDVTPEPETTEEVAEVSSPQEVLSKHTEGTSSQFKKALKSELNSIAESLKGESAIDPTDPKVLAGRLNALKTNLAMHPEAKNFNFNEFLADALSSFGVEHAMTSDLEASTGEGGAPVIYSGKDYSAETGYNGPATTGSLINKYELEGTGAEFIDKFIQGWTPEPNMSQESVQSLMQSFENNFDDFVKYMVNNAGLTEEQATSLMNEVGQLTGLRTETVADVSATPEEDTQGEDVPQESPKKYGDLGKVLAEDFGNKYNLDPYGEVYDHVQQFVTNWPETLEDLKGDSAELRSTIEYALNQKQEFIQEFMDSGNMSEEAATNLVNEMYEISGFPKTQEASKPETKPVNAETNYGESVGLAPETSTANYMNMVVRNWRNALKGTSEGDFVAKMQAAHGNVDEVRQLIRDSLVKDGLPFDEAYVDEIVGKIYDFAKIPLSQSIQAQKAQKEEVPEEAPEENTESVFARTYNGMSYDDLVQTGESIFGGDENPDFGKNVTNPIMQDILHQVLPNKGNVSLDSLQEILDEAYYSAKEWEDQFDDVPESWNPENLITSALIAVGQTDLANEWKEYLQSQGEDVEAEELQEPTPLEDDEEVVQEATNTVPTTDETDAWLYDLVSGDEDKYTELRLMSNSLQDILAANNGVLTGDALNDMVDLVIDELEETGMDSILDASDVIADFMDHFNLSETEVAKEDTPQPEAENQKKVEAQAFAKENAAELEGQDLNGVQIKSVKDKIGEIPGKGEPENPKIREYFSQKEDKEGIDPDEGKDVVSSGIVVMEPDGRMWIRSVSGNFNGTEYSFAKGGTEEGLSLQQNALKEVYEELGIEAEITGHLMDRPSNKKGKVRFYIGKRVDGNPADAGWETESTLLVDPSEAIKTEDGQGYLNKRYDHDVAAQVMEYLQNQGTPQQGEAQPEQVEDQQTEMNPHTMTSEQIMTEQTGEQQGSNKGGVFKGADGKERYVKLYEDDTKAQGEHIANEVYRALGLSAPASQMFEHEGQLGYASEMISDVKLLNDIIKENGGQLPQDVAEQILDGFIADAFLMNWDAVGSGVATPWDNAGIDAEGNLVRLDSGGALFKRGLEGDKSPTDLETFSEWENFVKKNPQYAEVFKAAGINGPDDMKEKAVEQINKLEELYKQYDGSWDKFVEFNTVGAELSPEDRKKFADLLEMRYTLALDKREELLKDLGGPDDGSEGGGPEGQGENPLTKGTFEVPEGADAKQALLDHYGAEGTPHGKYMANYMSTAINHAIESGEVGQQVHDYLTTSFNKMLNGGYFPDGVTEEHVQQMIEDTKNAAEQALAAKEQAEEPADGTKAVDEGVTSDVILGKKIAGAGGSNEGGVYEGTDGKKRYVKFYDDAVQAQGEGVANQVYADLGLTAPQSNLFEHEGKTAYASEFIEGTELGKMGLNKELADKILDGFAADVLTANWDAVGLTMDNILVTQDGNVARIDNGGTFLKRAQGGDKPDNVLHDIPEWNGFADPKINPSYAKVFQAAGISSADELGQRIVDQVDKLTETRNANGSWQAYLENKFGDTLDKPTLIKMASMMNERHNKLLDKAEQIKASLEEAQAPQVDQSSVEDVKAHYTNELGQIQQQINAGNKPEYDIGRTGGTFPSKSDKQMSQNKFTMLTEFLDQTIGGGFPAIPADKLLKSGDDSIDSVMGMVYKTHKPEAMKLNERNILDGVLSLSDQMNAAVENATGSTLQDSQSKAINSYVANKALQTLAKQGTTALSSISNNLDRLREDYKALDTLANSNNFDIDNSAITALKNSYEQTAKQYHNYDLATGKQLPDPKAAKKQAWKTVHSVDAEMDDPNVNELLKGKNSADYSIRTGLGDYSPGDSTFFDVEEMAKTGWKNVATPLQAGAAIRSMVKQWNNNGDLTYYGDKGTEPVDNSGVPNGELYSAVGAYQGSSNQFNEFFWKASSRGYDFTEFDALMPEAFDIDKYDPRLQELADDYNQAMGYTGYSKKDAKDMLHHLKMSASLSFAGEAMPMPVDMIAHRGTDNKQATNMLVKALEAAGVKAASKMDKHELLKAAKEAITNGKQLMGVTDSHVGTTLRASNLSAAKNFGDGTKMTFLAPKGTPGVYTQAWTHNGSAPGFQSEQELIFNKDLPVRIAHVALTDKGHLHVFMEFVPNPQGNKSAKGVQQASNAPGQAPKYDIPSDAKELKAYHTQNMKKVDSDTYKYHEGYTFKDQGSGFGSKRWQMYDTSGKLVGYAGSRYAAARKIDKKLKKL